MSFKKQGDAFPLTDEPIKPEKKAAETVPEPEPTSTDEDKPTQD